MHTSRETGRGRRERIRRAPWEADKAGTGHTDQPGMKEVGQQNRGGPHEPGSRPGTEGADKAGTGGTDQRGALEADQAGHGPGWEADAAGPVDSPAGSQASGKGGHG